MCVARRPRRARVCEKKSGVREVGERDGVGRPVPMWTTYSTTSPLCQSRSYYEESSGHPSAHRRQTSSGLGSTVVGDHTGRPGDDSFAFGSGLRGGAEQGEAGRSGGKGEGSRESQVHFFFLAADPPPPLLRTWGCKNEIAHVPCTFCRAPRAKREARRGKRVITWPSRVVPHHSTTQA